MAQRTETRTEGKAALQNRRVAFISVFDKTGLEPVARALVEKYGYVLLSTGGTRKYLAEKGVPAVESSEITGFDQLLGGRVKSLHPEIFAGILAERETLSADEAPSFLIDTVIVNLYPFEAERAKAEGDLTHLVHFIDIGGSSLIRAAAKNHAAVNVLCRPEQYDRFLQALEAGNGQTDLSFRKQLAFEAFRRSQEYDMAIADDFAYNLNQEEMTETHLDTSVLVPLVKIQDLRYGENPHQKAALYGLGAPETDFECLHGKELSYNNILDMQAAWNIAMEFTGEEMVCAVIKHNNPCGVALSHRSVLEAYRNAFNVDPLSAFGGVVSFNRPVDVATAREMKEVFLEVIIAPGFDPEALEILQGKKNLRLVQRTFGPIESGMGVRQVASDLFLLQYNDPEKETQVDKTMKIVSKKKPTPSQVEDLVFAWKVVKHVKSNAIVLAKNGVTVGIGGGQTSRIGALENALKIACDEAKDAVMASDGFLPHVDNIHAAAQSRIAAIIQPGGSIKDKDVIELADQSGMVMAFSGVREFLH